MIRNGEYLSAMCVSSLEEKTKEKNKKQEKVLVGLWRKGNPHVLLVGMQNGAATVENRMEVPQKVSNPTSGCISKRIEIRISKSY